MLTTTKSGMTGNSASVSANWSAVGSMAMCVALLIAAEFMPVSLRTPIARDLHASVGMAGQAISTSGLFASAAVCLRGGQWMEVASPSVTSIAIERSAGKFTPPCAKWRYHR
jgi:hypothetical protein